MENIVDILMEIDKGECKVNINVLHDTLLKLPAEKYIALYDLMRRRMNGTDTELHGVTLC